MSRSVTPQEQKRDLIILGAAGPWLLSATEFAEDEGWRIVAVVNNLQPGEADVPSLPYPVYRLGDLPAAFRAIPPSVASLRPRIGDASSRRRGQRGSPGSPA